MELLNEIIVMVMVMDGVEEGADCASPYHIHDWTKMGHPPDLLRLHGDGKGFEGSYQNHKLIVGYH